MVKKLILGLAVCCLFCENCSGMLQRSKSDSNVLQSKPVSVVHVRKSSDPVTAQEKAHAIEITSMDQFRKLTRDQTKELNSVTFREIEVSEEFIDKFGELFSNGVNKLSFKRCHTVSGYTFSYLFDSLYQVVNLEIIDCELTIEDADTILSLISPYVIRTIDFSGNRFNKRDTYFKNMVERWITNRVCLDKPILCTP